jgi:hypothetical protein
MDEGSPLGLHWHPDALEALNGSLPLEAKVAAIHEALYAQLEFVDRISVAAYDPKADVLKTFLAARRGNDLRYEAGMSDAVARGHPQAGAARGAGPERSQGTTCTRA